MAILNSITLANGIVVNVTDDKCPAPITVANSDLLTAKNAVATPSSRIDALIKVLGL